MRDTLRAEVDLQLDEAWNLHEESEVREDLCHAIEILWRGLYQMLDTLEAIQESLSPEQENVATESIRSEAGWSEPPTQLIQ